MRREWYRLTGARSTGARYGLAVLAVLASLLLRALADPVLGDRVPFAAFFVAIAVSAWWGGRGPALAAVLLGGILSNWFFVSPRGALGLDDLQQVIATGVYLAVGVVIAILAGAMHAARAEAERLASEAVEGQAALRREVEQREQATEGLRLASERLRLHVENSPLGVVEWDEALSIRRWTGEAERIYGWTAEEVEGRCVTDLRWIHEDDWPAVHALMTDMLSRKQTHSVKLNRNYHKDGRIVWGEWYNSVVLEGEKLVSVLSLVLDVTQRQRDQQELASLARIADENPGPVLRLDPRGRLLYANPASVPLLRTLKTCVGESAPAFLRELAWSEERVQRVIDCYGRIFAFSVARVPESGYVNLYGTDITEAKRLEAERARDAAALAEANESKDLFFNALSHELRTPLAAISTAVEILRRSRAGERQREAAGEIIDRSVRHQARLIDDLLDLSRIMRGKVRMQLEPLDLREVVWTEVDVHRDAARRGRLGLSVEVPERPVFVLGDRIRLGQVLSNLLTNAIKYTPAGGSILCALVTEGGEARLRVRDTGVGMTPAVLSQIFEPFRQADTSLARSSGGLGIGLTIARSMAEQHGGALRASSSGPGRGSELTLVLPVLERAEPAQTSAVDPSGGSGPRRVLVVEDNPDIRSTMVMLLELLGHTVLSADNAEVALELIRRERLDLALVDIGLPGMDGYDLARHVRADPARRGLRLIAVTGYAGEEHRRKALEAGFDEHLAKPVEQDRLLQALFEPPQGFATGQPS